MEYKDDLSLYYIDAYDYINQRFKDILNMNSGIDSITVYTNNRSLISDHYFIKHIDDNVKKEDWYNAVVKANGKTTFSKMKKDESEE